MSYWQTHRLTVPARVARAGPFGLHYNTVTGLPVCGAGRYSRHTTRDSSLVSCPACRRIVERKLTAGSTKD